MQFERLTSNQSQICKETVTNLGSQTLIDLNVQYLWLNLDSLGTQQTQMAPMSLAAGESQTLTQTLDYAALPPAHYACVLQAQIGCEWQTLDFKTFTVTNAVSSECSTVYAVHDQGVADSQLFSYRLNNHIVKPLGPLYPRYDLEGFDIHPYTNQLYVSSGRSKSRLYQVDGATGKLKLIGDIGFNHVHALSFHPDGSLWGWCREGLIRIDITTGRGELVYPSNVKIEGIAWDNAGKLLYGVGSGQTERHSTLWVYRQANLQPLCYNLPGEVEGLEMRPDNQLVFGNHEEDNLNFNVYNVSQCKVVEGEQLRTSYHDIEAIVWPAANCTARESALRAFLTALSQQEVFIGADRYVQVTLEGQTHHGQLAEAVTQGSATNGKLHLAAIPDANQDGIDDFLITYPDGQQQVLYYLKVTGE